ncbi:214_t:CDS:2 [Acaulospora morrowiae]|uniref:214_t:CDS:1 n=1 Tax=Acaulospora morrowiae TaxID=94023 RepID=A0A9N9FI17_9GLOM|nr:214_t:CDS:2 [Acaulospora morrowiae]
MQSPSTIGDFPHSPPSVRSKRNFGLENQFETFMQQQQQQAAKARASAPVANNNATQPSNNTTTANSTRNTTQRPGVAASFLYKLTEFAAYTSAFATEAYQTLTVGAKVEQEVLNNGASRSRKGYSQYFDEDLMQIGDNSDDPDTIDEDIVDRGITRSNGNLNGVLGQWSPTQSAPKDNRISTLGLQDSATVTSSPRQIQFATTSVEPMQQESSPIDISSTTPPASAKRRQIRVRRPRRPLRRKSSSNDISAQRGYEDQDQMLLKVNEKLADMITQGKAALRSTVNVTEVEIMLAEEKERSERIMKEVSLQAPTNRRRRNTGSSSDYDYYGGSLSDSGSYSAPESSSYCDYGYGPCSGPESPNYRHSSPIHHNTPTQYGSPGMFGPSVGYNLAINSDYSMLGSGRYIDSPVGGTGSFPGITQAYNGSSSSGRFGNVPSNRYGGSMSPSAYGNPGSNNVYSKQNGGPYTGANNHGIYNNREFSY